MEEFSRVTGPVADAICKRADVDPKALAPKVSGDKVEAMHAVMVASHASLPPTKRLVAKFAKSTSTVRDEVMEEGSGFTPGLADQIIRAAHIEPPMKAKLLTPTAGGEALGVPRAAQVRILPPPATCVVPVGEELCSRA
jgi:DNA topoisomerase VI subunit B